MKTVEYRSTKSVLECRFVRERMKESRSVAMKKSSPVERYALRRSHLGSKRTLTTWKA